MSPKENIEKTIQQFDIKINPTRDEEIIARLLDAQSKTIQSKLAVRPDIWSKIINSKITKYAAAAVIIIAVLIGLNHLGIPMDGAQKAFAVQDVIDAMNQVKCLHAIIHFEDGTNPNEKERSKKVLELEDGSEYWESNDPAISIYKSADGVITFADYETGEMNRYDPKTNTIEINEHAPLAQPDYISIADKYLKKIEQQIGLGAIAEYSTATVDGQTVTLVKVSNCTLGAPNDTLAMYINPKTLLPIKLYWTTAEPGGSKYWFVFDYPNTFPADIYQAGAPQDSITRNIIVNDEFLGLLETLNTADSNSMSKLPRHYIAIEVKSNDNIAAYPVNGIAYVNVIYHNDNIYREDSIRYQYNHSDDRSDIVRDIPQLENTFESQFRFWHSDEIEKYNFERNKIVMADKTTGGFITLIRDDNSSTGWNIADKRNVANDTLFNYHVVMNSPLLEHWGHNFDLSSIIPMTKSRKVIEDPYSKANNLICVEVLTSGYVYKPTEEVTLPTRELFYLDPQMDYICRRMLRIMTKKAWWHDEPDWLKRDSYDPPRDSYRLWEIAELGQTDSGLIYAREQVYDSNYFDMNDDAHSNAPDSIVIENPLRTSIYLTEYPVFPEGVFDSDIFSKYPE